MMLQSRIRNFYTLPVKVLLRVFDEKSLPILISAFHPSPNVLKSDDKFIKHNFILEEPLQILWIVVK